jgi:UDP-glucose 4-epimerase
MDSAKDVIMVVGSEGFIGAHLVRKLHDTGRKVIAVGRHKPREILPDIQHIVIESGNPEHITDVLTGCSTVIWLASVSTPGSSAGLPLEELHGNLQPLLTLLQAMKKREGCPLIYISSGGTLYGDVAGGDAGEEMPIRPKSYYGAGKAAAEHFITSWSHQFRRPAVIIRPSNIYGPGQTQRKGFGIIPTAFEKLIQNQPLTIWGDGGAIRDYLFIDDFISLFLKLLENPLLSGTRILNAASGEGTHLNHLLDLIAKTAGKPFDRIYERGRTVDVRRIVLNNSAAKRFCNWQPEISLQEGLRRTWAWFQRINQ